MEPEESVDSSICSKSITVLENSNDSTFVKGQTSDSDSNKVLIEEQEEENEDNPQITYETSSISSHVNEEGVMNTNTAISREETGSRTTHEEASKAKAKEFHVINLSDVEEEEEEERVCRICHFGCNQSQVINWELIEIGCKCKNGLHLAHKHCAQLWFKLKGNRVCEICGGRAKNVKVGERREEREREMRREMEIVRREMEEGEGERRSGCGGGEASCFWFFMLLIFLLLHWLFKRIDAIKTDPIIKL